MMHLQRWIIHPPILGLYPVFALIAHDVSQINLGDTIRPLWVTLVCVLVIWLILWLFFHDVRKAALVCTLASMLFFTYGHVYTYLEHITLLGVQLGRHRYLLPIWLGLMGGGTWVVVAKLRDLSSWTLALNATSLAAIVLSIAQIGSYQIRFLAAQSESKDQSSAICETTLMAEDSPPDIYYIILDAYTRSDVLDDVYGYDNSDFLDALEEMGFYVAPGSLSNYGFTELSLSSSLNMNYLESLDERLGDGSSSDLTPLWPLLKASEVRRNLECMGYTVVAFDSGYSWSGWDNADIYFNDHDTILADMELSGDVNAFEGMLLSNSAFIILADAAKIVPALLKVDLESPHRAHYNRMLYMLDSLEYHVASIEGPKFVFAHVLIPHTPFVFGPQREYLTQLGAFSLEGSLRKMTPEERVQGYTGQVHFVSTRIENALRAILAESDPSPIMIIQGDHGLDGPLESQMAILNAYHLPDGDTSQLYETITPVNSFRIVFDQYFGGDYGLLEDRSYYSRPADPFNFTPIINSYEKP